MSKFRYHERLQNTYIYIQRRPVVVVLVVVVVVVGAVGTGIAGTLNNK